MRVWIRMPCNSTTLGTGQKLYLPLAIEELLYWKISFPQVGVPAWEGLPDKGHLHWILCRDKSEGVWQLQQPYYGYSRLRHTTTGNAVQEGKDSKETHKIMFAAKKKKWARLCLENVHRPFQTAALAISSAKPCNFSIGHTGSLSPIWGSIELPQDHATKYQLQNDFPVGNKGKSACKASDQLNTSIKVKSHLPHKRTHAAKMGENQVKILPCPVC